MVKHNHVIPKQSMKLANGSIDIETLAKVDAGCGDKLTHGLKHGKDKEGVSEADRKQIEKDMVAIGFRVVTGKPGDEHSTGVAV